MRRLSTYIQPLMTAILLAAGLPLHARTFSRASNEYNKDFNGYTFKHTRGFPDTPHMLGWPSEYEDPDNWEFMTEAEKQRFQDLGIDVALPDFSFMTPADSKYPIATGQVRQRTHTVEHILYAMPGDLVPMYPYYRMTDRFIPDYEDKFSHWYDFTDEGCLTYELDGRTYDLIDFLDDRQHIHRSEANGFFGGETLNDLTNEWKRIPGTFANFYCPPTHDGKLPFKDGRSEFVIAADFSQTFSIDRHIDKDSEVITEPLIAFRHIFRIRDGRAFADEFSGSVEKNRSYINRHQKMVSAPAGISFQIRLESPLPEDYRLGQSIYYFKRQDGTYGRVCGHDIRVINGDTGDAIANPGFNVWDHDDRRVAVKRGYAAREADGSYYTGKSDPDFVNYVTMLYNSSAPAGHYIVQILGKDENDQMIKLRDADGNESELVIMEYNVTFLPEEGASIVTEADLYGNDKFKHARDEQLREDYGQPADVIDFDEYIKINRLDDKDNDLKEKLISYTKYRRETGDSRVPNDAAVYNGKETDPTANGKEHSFYKWPVSWDQSNYSFGYRYRHDYNMYMLATHSRCVPYKDAAARWDDNMAGDGTGLYDRLYYKTRRQYGDTEPSKVEQGYFYYVNAASDPGVSARLNISIPCPGSRIVVSAWVAEFSEAEETANISFNFVAVMKESGERIVLHNFITGYVPSDLCGKWLNVYYSFVPRLAEFTAEEGNLFELVDHYELELDNNTTSSAGADYAIDDIRAYVVPPMAEAEQLTFACDNDDIRLRLGTPFETILEKIGKTETIGNDNGGDDVNLYYAFLDKDKFDALYKDGKGDLEKAYATAVVKTKGSNGSTINYGKVTFKSNYLKNDDFAEEVKKVPANIVEDKAYRFTETSGERMIVFEHTVQLSYLRAGRDYYVVFRSSLGNGDSPATGEADFFNADDDCSNKCVSIIRPANTIKVDGEIRKDIDRLIVCENQSPVIQVNIAGRFEDGSIKEVEKNARFDWFAGTLNDYYSAADAEGNLLSDALWVLRGRYSAKESVSGVKADPDTYSGDDRIFQWMIDIIKKYTEPTEEYPEGQLVLYRSSYVVPGVSIPAEGNDAISSVVAIPIRDNGLDKEYILCTNPTELELKFANKSPLLRHGLTGMTYPASMVDVPLRIGLEQIRLEKDMITGEDMKTITIPVRKVTSSSSSLTLAKESAAPADRSAGCVILVQTNDPQYRHLGTLVDDKETENLLWIGEVTELKASKEATDNLFKVKFDKTFDFKEGYFYRMRFQYAETAETADETVCNGHDVFTLKIVPRYLLWTGGENLNWNCDANWSRLDSKEIYSDKKAGDHKRFVTDGGAGNARVQSYSPLDFTHTVIKDAPEAPWLYAYGSDGESVITDEIGLPTPLIHYDMAAWYPDEKDIMKTGCKAWYANTCKEIHFKPGATIMNQQQLSYEKAWVDMELSHSRWYTLSSPLKQTYAGDFYLPTAGARQMTELFQPIKFDNKLEINDRFRPAVYQRGWDKSVANVYELGKEGPRNVMVKTFWSHVYNDVEEQYGGGTGFSLKTDVSELAENGHPEKVLFRLPKADTEYWYFTQDKDTQKAGHRTDIDRSADGQYKLNPGNGTLTSITATEGQYFLVGNPFMTHMDIQKFLDKNKEKIEQKFWIVTESGQTAGNSAVDVAIAPMQGFFVKTLTASKTLTLKYDETMMRRYDASGERLIATTRSEDETSSLRISAYNDGVCSSETEIWNPDFTEGCDVEAIDNRELDIPAVVYVLKDGQAMSICHDYLYAPMEIGVLASEAVSTTLLFEGIDESEELMLYDKLEDDYTPLTDGMQLTLDGTSAGRLFITREPLAGSLACEIEVKVGKGCLTAIDRAVTGILNVTVYDLPGRIAAASSTDANTLSLQLPAGVYVAEVANGTSRKALRIVITD